MLKITSRRASTLLFLLCFFVASYCTKLRCRGKLTVFVSVCACLAWCTNGSLSRIQRSQLINSISCLFQKPTSHHRKVSWDRLSFCISFYFNISWRAKQGVLRVLYEPLRWMKEKGSALITNTARSGRDKLYWCRKSVTNVRAQDLITRSGELFNYLSRPLRVFFFFTASGEAYLTSAPPRQNELE